MDTTRKHKDTYNELLFLLYCIIFTITPSFTKIFGHPVSRIASIIVLPLIFFLNFNKINKFPRFIFIWLTLVFCLKSFSYFFNDEYERLIIEIVEVIIPLIILSYGFSIYPGISNRVITITIITSAIICIFGLIEEFKEFNVFSLIENYQFDNPRLNTNTTYRYGIYRIEQGFNTALTYELYLGLCIGLTLFRLIVSRKWFIYFVILVLQIVNSIFTASRGITFFLFAFLSMGIAINVKRISVKAIILFCILLSSCLIFVYMSSNIISEGIKDNIDSIVSIIKKGDDFSIEEDNSIDERVGFQSVAYNSLKDTKNLFFGVGEYGLRQMRTIDNNWLLEVSAFGLFGFTAFLLLTFYPLYVLYIQRKTLSANNELNDVFNVFYSCMTITILFYASSLYTVAQMEEARTFYLIACICMFGGSTFVQQSNDSNNILNEPEP